MGSTGGTGGSLTSPPLQDTATRRGGEADGMECGGVDTSWCPWVQAVELRNGLFGAIEIVVWFPAVMSSVVAFPLD